MQFKKITGSLFLFLCLGLIGTSIWFLSAPVKVSANDPVANCTAKCGGGRTVTCTGDACVATDYLGCTGGTQQQPQSKLCPQ
jgi:hypothetical protein